MVQDVYKLSCSYMKISFSCVVACAGNGPINSLSWRISPRLFSWSCDHRTGTIDWVPEGTGLWVGYVELAVFLLTKPAFPFTRHLLDNSPSRNITTLFEVLVVASLVHGTQYFCQSSGPLVFVFRGVEIIRSATVYKFEPSIIRTQLIDSPTPRSTPVRYLRVKSCKVPTCNAAVG